MSRLTTLGDLEVNFLISIHVTWTCTTGSSKVQKQLIQYVMASGYDDKSRAEEIVRAPIALRAKQISNEIEQSEEWKNKKSDVKWDVLEEKARQCANFRN